MFLAKKNLTSVFSTMVIPQLGYRAQLVACSDSAGLALPRHLKTRTRTVNFVNLNAVCM